MRIVVCIKQIPNPDALAAVLRIDEAAQAAVLPPGHPWVVSPFDEQAIEAALRIRDRLGADVKITAITLGPESARAALKQALALGADDAVHLLDRAFDAADGFVVGARAGERDPQARRGRSDTRGTTSRRLGCGHRRPGHRRNSGPAVGELRLRDRSEGRRALVERVLQDGFETVGSPLPALVTVSNELGEVRKPNLRETMRAARKPVTVWNAADLEIPAQHASPRRVLERLFLPQKNASCEMIDGRYRCGARCAPRPAPDRVQARLSAVMSALEDILIVVESVAGRLSAPTQELIAAGLQLAGKSPRA